uniref:OTU domain-containing protein 3-like n=1 Tax=Saccoglossus kowalevskii TaxID=10224 RepID=A0ABM0LW50_SACKO
DIQLIHETLADHDGDVTATIDFLIQIVFASNQSDSYRSSSPESSKADDHQVDSLWSESGTGSRLFGDVHSDSTSQSESTSNHNTGSSGGAIPKSNQRSRSTGRERKRQNKMEKKRRQMERHRQKIMGEKEEGDESDDNDVDPTLLKDLGMLAI